MKFTPVLLSVLVLGAFASARAQSVFFSPDSLTDTANTAGDISVWNIDVTGGGIAPGPYEAWCFSPGDAAYEDSDYGQNFESTLIPLNEIIYHASSPGTNKTSAMVNYVFDTFYGYWNNTMLSTEEIHERFRAFHHVLWEIQRDYIPDIGVSSLDILSGDHIDHDGLNPSNELIFSDLSSAYAGLSESYTSSRYQLSVIDGRNLLKNGLAVGTTFQPLIVVGIIPEPSTPVLGGLAVGLLALRRRRVGMTRQV